MPTKDHNDMRQGLVVSGKQLGRTIGFPTANVLLGTQKIHPATYTANCLIGTFAEHYAARKQESQSLHDFVRRLEAYTFPCMAVYLAGSSVIECHLHGYDNDLYGQQLTIVPLMVMRDNQKFSGLDALKDQLARDQEQSINHQCLSMHFGTFDILHPGHIWIMRQTRMRGRAFVTVIAHDANRKHETTGLSPGRAQRILDLGWHHHDVLVGHASDYLYHVDRLHPDVICLGYDQDHGLPLLADYRVNHPQCSVVVCQDFFSDRYTSTLYRQKNGTIL